MRKRTISITAIIVCFMLMALTGCGMSGGKGELLSLSKYVVGQWTGQVDVSQMLYEELSSELGMDVSPESVYSDIYLTFDEDGTCFMELDLDGFAKAVGKCVEPYVSAIFGFDTDMLVDLIMQQVVSEMDAGSATENGYYEVNEETGEIIIEREDGTAQSTLNFNEDLHLELVDEEFGQTIVFEKTD